MILANKWQDHPIIIIIDGECLFRKSSGVLGSHFNYFSNDSEGQNSLIYY